MEVLYCACMDHMKGKVRSKRADLLQSMRDMPDHQLSVRRCRLPCMRLRPAPIDTPACEQVQCLQP